MKNLLLILIFPLQSLAQINPCEKIIQPVIAASAGYSFNWMAEGGILGFHEKIGLFTGCMMYDVETPGKYGVDTKLVLAPYARLSYRLMYDQYSDWRHYFTVYYGLHIYGFSYRCAYILTDMLMITAEPHYSKEQQFGFNLWLNVKIN